MNIIFHILIFAQGLNIILFFPGLNYFIKKGVIKIFFFVEKFKPSKLTSSLSMSYFNKDEVKTKKLFPSMSLQFVSDKENGKRNLNDLNLFIKNSLNRNVCSEIHSDTKNDPNTKSEIKFCSIRDIDKELFDCLIASFRLIAVVLPPSNKRKLHFLLRFLNRLKANEYLGIYVSNLNKTENICFDGIENSNFVDISCMNNDNSNTENFKTKLEQIEFLLVTTFLKSIISFDDSQPFEKILSAKIVKILINNYSDIMKIPNDLFMTFKTRLKNASTAHRDKSSMLINHESTSFIQESKFDKKSFKNFVESNENKLSQSRKMSMNPAQQGQKIKKALNILGLNDSISYPSLNQKYESEKISKDNILTASLSENINRNSQFSFEQSFNQLQTSSCLNSSVISAFPSKSSLFQSSSSINFPRIFSNKKWKKENLI